MKAKIILTSILCTALQTVSSPGKTGNTAGGKRFSSRHGFCTDSITDTDTA